MPFETPGSRQDPNLATDTEVATAVATEATRAQLAEGLKQDAATAATDAELAAGLSSKEPTVTGGTTAQYYRGDKTWVDLNTAVRGSTLTGLTTATNSTILASDNVLVSFGKLQAQVNALVAGAVALSSATPADLGTTGSAGVSNLASRSDHVHKGPYITGGTAATSAILLATASVDLVVTLSGTMPNTNYNVIRFVNPTAVSLLATLTATVKSKTTTTVTITLTNNGIATVALGQIVEVLAVSPSV